MKPIKDKKPIRSYSGEVWKTNASNKLRLIEDFGNKCAYCDDHDKYTGGPNSFHVEHFAPKDKFSLLEFTYDNLLYSCPYCNISKSNKWVSDKPDVNTIGDKGFIDPCRDEYYMHLERDNDGRIVYKTKLGEYIYYELKLYLKRHQILYNLEEVWAKKKLVKEKIEHKRQLSEDTTTLEDLYSQLCIVFCEYYDLFLDC